MLLRGVIPIMLIPFDVNGRIDEASLRRVIQFELAGGAHGIGVGGFASEAYKLGDNERMRCAEIVAEEVNGCVPLIIGISAGSTELAIEQAYHYMKFKPAALMTLPPAMMPNSEKAIVDHYVGFAKASEAPIMVQVSPHIPGYSAVDLSVDALANIARHAPNVKYFKIEGPGSAERIRALKVHVGDSVCLFGGVGGMAVREEWQAGAAGLLPGCGFNEYFVAAWQAWDKGDKEAAESALKTIQPLVEAVSGRGHEYSLHARKYLFHRAGIVSHATVRRPTVEIEDATIVRVAQISDELSLRIGVA